MAAMYLNYEVKGVLYTFKILCIKIGMIGFKMGFNSAC